VEKVWKLRFSVRFCEGVTVSDWKVSKHSFSNSVAETYAKLPLEMLGQSRSVRTSHVSINLLTQNREPYPKFDTGEHSAPGVTYRSQDLAEGTSHVQSLSKFLIHSLAILYSSLSLSYTLQYSIISILFFRHSFYNQPYCNLLSHCSLVLVEWTYVNMHSVTMAYT
jgi:hypothetical protein